MTHRFETVAIHAGNAPEEKTGAVSVPIFQTSTYAQRALGEHTGFEYARTRNPTRDALEANLAALEGGKHGLCFSSGLAAVDAMMHALSAGDHVVATDDVYGGTFRLFDKVYRRHGFEFDFAPAAEVAAYGRLIRPGKTKLVWLETPTNPMLSIVDIAKVAELAHRAGAAVVVDNTFATPFLQQPLALGADLVLHSVTKYLGGHSDVVGGAIVTSSDDWHQRLRFLQNAVGAVPGPMDCFLTLRGTKTLAVRMERHSSNGQTLAERLRGHPKVARVIYPGLAEHPGHSLAKQQMRGFGGMISFVVKGGLDASRRLLSKMEIFTLAESLGGVESLIEHPAIMTHASVPKEAREARGIDDGLIRISAGIEHVDDLWADLSKALERA
jgi:cystathionine gamma-lyase